MVGLPNGASFANATLARLSPGSDANVCGIELGMPFWSHPEEANNILSLDSNGADCLVRGDALALLCSLVTCAARIALARAYDLDVTAGQVMKVRGHEYRWPDIEPEIVAFLDRVLANRIATDRQP
ncbi:MAG: hypothetical protein R6X12_06950 [bacterium]